MPRIHTVAQDSLITASDKLIGSDGAQNNGFVTRNYSVGGIKNFVLDGTHAGSFTTITSSGNGTIGADLSVAGNLAVTGNATISGNLTFGDADTDTVSFSADVNSHVIPDITNTYDLGASDKIWRNIYADNVEGYLKTADAATTYLALAGGTLTGGLIGTTATFTGDIQLGNETTDAASEIKAYGELGLRADSDNDTGYTWGVELFRTRFGNAGGTAIQFNVNQYSNGTSGNLLDSNTIFDTIEVGDVIYGLGGGSNYQSNTDETVASVNGFYNASSQFLSATDSTGAAYFQVTMSAPVSYQSSAHLTVLPAGETFVSGGGGSSIKFYADTTTIGTLNESSFSIPGKATIGAFTIPNTIGSAQQVLRVPSSGTELEWKHPNINGYFFPSAAGTAGQMLKIPSSGTRLEWGAAAASAVVGNGTNTVPSAVNDFVINIDNKNGGMAIVTEDATDGGPEFRLATNTQQNAFILDYDKATAAVRMQRHGAYFLKMDANKLQFPLNAVHVSSGANTADSSADDFVINLNQSSGGMSIVNSGTTSGWSRLGFGKSDNTFAYYFNYNNSDSSLQLRKGGNAVLQFDAGAPGGANLADIKPQLKLSNVSTYADDTAAGAGGLTSGMIYKKSDGTLMIKS